ncbi:ROK family transcriptional regulator [Sinomonas sp. JGH33]|uniref:ROK family transcriptional regulator n=1 Tax=Sinomonas terricola TaxID=3110330 RepID=A0ABU5TAU3_9MICC|nr:ROK family transcriptional regulator [Sinomonas sp. JGH33]MEA5456698.1 ROK family transcriptional regulator [Sinomonas sp. JGH33]
MPANAVEDRAAMFEVPALKDPHRSGLFSLVLRHAPISRGDLAQRASLDQSTVTRTLRPLIENGYLKETPTAPHGRGRPQRIIEVVPDRHCAVGVKIGPRLITAVVTDLGANVVARAEETETSLDPHKVLTAASGLVARLLDAHPGSREKALGVGIGVGGHVDPEAGVCRYSPILGWHDVEVVGPVAEAVGLPVTVHNDVNALAVAEQLFGNGRSARNFAVATIGPGIGLGLVVEGVPYGGTRGLAGELGHIPLVPDGPVCRCGRRGCLEALAGDAAIAAAAGVDDVGAALDAARTGSGAQAERARRAFAEAGAWVGRGLAIVANLTAPELIVLTGEGAAAYDLLGDSLAAAFEEHVLEGRDFLPRLKVDASDADIWARGAACLAIQQALR